MRFCVVLLGRGVGSRFSTKTSVCIMMHNDEQSGVVSFFKVSFFFFFFQIYLFFLLLKKYRTCFNAPWTRVSRRENQIPRLLSHAKPEILRLRPPLLLSPCMASVAYIFCSLRATPVAALYIHRRKKLSFFLSDYSSVDFVSILGFVGGGS